MRAEEFGLRAVGNSGGEQLVICPFHNDKRPSAWWNPIKNVFYCAVCQKGLSAFQLATQLGVETFDLEQESYDENTQDYDLTYDSPPYRGTVSDPKHPYLQERNVSTIAAEFYRVKIATREPEAVYFPVYDISDNQTGAVERYIEGPVRYKKYGYMQPLWPMWQLKELEENERLYIFEGPFSVLRWTTVFPYLRAFALMGAKANQRLADMLRDLEVVFLYDHDTAGINACYRMRELLPTAHCYTLPISVDDMEDKQIENLMKRFMLKVGVKREGL